MWNRDNKDFKEGLKATSLFGGLQVFKILIAIINSKIIAVLLGPMGMGIAGMLSSTINIIGSITNLGLGTSAIRDVSESYSSNDRLKFSRTVSVFRHLVWFTGVFGFILCFVLSPFLSKATFGNFNYSISFAILSITLLIGQISSGLGVVLQGTRNFKSMVASGVYGSFLGLIVSIPLYYFFKYNGIVPYMVISSLISLLMSFYFSRKISIEKVSLSCTEVFKEGKVMLKLGFFIALQGFMSVFCAYFLRLYISNRGTLEDVGLYNSGFAMINTYVGLIFTAMGTEYYPRLSGYVNDMRNFNSTINQQIELSLLLICPMVAFFLIFGKLAIVILYSSKFLGINMMITFGLLGLLFKAPGWCLGFSFLAKGDSRSFWINEFVSEIYFLFFNILFYRFWGLDGIGASFLLNYFIYWVQCIFVCSKKYNYKMKMNIMTMLIPQFLLSMGIVLISVYCTAIYKYIIGTCFVLVSMYVSYKRLNERIDVKNIIYKRFGK